MLNDVSTSQAQAPLQPLTRRAIRDAERRAALIAEAPAFASRRERRAAERLAAPEIAAPAASMPAPVAVRRPAGLGTPRPTALAAPLTTDTVRILKPAPAVAPAQAPELPAVVVPATSRIAPALAAVDELRSTADLSDITIDEVELPISIRRNLATMQPVASRRRGSKRAFVRVKREHTRLPLSRGAVVRSAAGVAMLGVAASVAVVTTLPAAAQNEQASSDSISTLPGAQSLTVGAGTVDTAGAAVSERGETYAVATMGTATAYNTMFGVQRPDANTYANNPTAAVQWPFPVGVVISDYFGGRVAPCSGCSSDHKGVDFTPGEGTPIGSVAAGRVTEVVTTDGGGLGVHVKVEHIVNGERVVSVYGHMLMGSIPVKVGDIVNVGDELGKVGNTGASTGAHLHLEIHVNGVQVDPMAWLKANNVATTIVDRPEAAVHA